ncbi:MAG: PH domain-containing protein, partial [Bacteroidota bacterium]
MEEKIIWSGSASQWTNFMYYIICVPLSAVFGLGLFMALWRFLNTKYHIYEITNQRIIEHKGVLSKT